MAGGAPVKSDLPVKLAPARASLHAGVTVEASPGARRRAYTWEDPKHLDLFSTIPFKIQSPTTE